MSDRELWFKVMARFVVVTRGVRPSMAQVIARYRYSIIYRELVRRKVCHDAAHGDRRAEIMMDRVLWLALMEKLVLATGRVSTKKVARDLAWKLRHRAVPDLRSR